MSGQRAITDGVGLLADGQLTVNGIEAASGGGANVIGTATQTALDLKLDKTAAPTRASLGIANVDNTSDLAKPISAATQEALDGLGQTTSMATALAQSAFFANYASAYFPPESTAAYPPASQQRGHSLRKRASNYIELKVNRIFANELFTKRIVMPPPCGCWMVNAVDAVDRENIGDGGRNGSKLSSVSFDLKGLHMHDYTLSRLGYLRVATARFLHSWANVGTGNNTVSAGGIIVTIAVGVYTAQSLLTAILTAATGPLTGLSFDSSTGMYGGVVGVVSGTLGNLMGFSNGVFNRPANLIFTGSINVDVVSLFATLVGTIVTA
ncbi:hypothetical protein B484DRAFT_394711 [Ochromonadaceae sp. CCMP2298]|nr:hypothetical protein B484DRAFT_394711 [Ochromonadaceae sp. CCMP2298]